MLEVVVFSVIILFLCVFFLSVGILFKKKGAFPNTHIGGNPALVKKKIKCTIVQDFEDIRYKNLFDRMNKIINN